MALLVSFTPATLTRMQYDEAIKRLQAAGAWVPKGLQYHACYGSEGKLRVAEVWESRQAFEAFGKTLMPILQQVGINPGQPEVSEVQNIVKG